LKKLSSKIILNPQDRFIRQTPAQDKTAAYIVGMGLMEFPAVSQSRLEFWKDPQYTRSGMWWFTLFFGFVGLHHLLLRSPQTALLFFIFNGLLLGYPWFYDLIQLSSKDIGGLGTEGLNTYGLGHPFGSLGLGQGMWVPDGEQIPDTKMPSPWLFLAYVALLPVGFLSTLIAGDKNNALSRFALLTVVPLGWVLGTIAMLYDCFITLVKPAELFAFGTKRFFPFTALGMDTDGHSPNITNDTQVKRCPSGGILQDIAKTGIAVGSLAATTVGLGPVVQPIIASGRALEQTVVSGVEGLVDGAKVVVDKAGEIPPILGKIGKLAEIAGTSSIPNIPSIPSIPKMKGGAITTPLEYLTMGCFIAVVGGAFLLTAGRFKNVPAKDDTPPKA
jgi:hypothetical protein